jgi:hypothetical protein
MTVADTEGGRRTWPLMRVVGVVTLIVGAAFAGHASGATAVTTHQLRE